MSNEYGVARFYESKHWSRSGLKEHWLLQPKLKGDDVVNGDFESWSGTEGGCTDCPTDWMCDCTTGGGDINPETTHIYKGSTSVKLDAAGIFGSALLQTKDFLANKVYQISFWCKSEDGVEDLYFLVGKLDITETYRFPTQKWGAGLNVYGMDNISTTWTKVSIYVDAGPVAKLAASMYGFGIIFAQNQGTAVYISDFQIREVETEITGEMGNVLSVGVVTISDPPSFPEWGDSEELLGRVGSGPAGNMGTKFDGVGDHLSRADDDSFDPVTWDSEGSFSVGARVMTDTVAAGTEYIIDKWGAAGNRGWSLYRSTANLGFAISDDGTNIDANSVTVFTADTLHSFVSTFNVSGGAGAYENKLYYNSYQVDTDSTMSEGKPFNSTADLQVGAQVGTGFWSGFVGEVTIWEGALSAIEANKYISPYFPGNNHGDGFYVDTCTQATTWANCSTQKCRDGTPNACQAEGTGVMGIFDTYTELCTNNAFEDFTGDDSSPNFTQWIQSGTITAYRSSPKHGNVSARLISNGNGDVERLTANCIAVSPATVYYMYSAIKKLSSDSYVFLGYNSYTDGACANFDAQNTIFATSTLAQPVWKDIGSTFTTGGSINSIRPWLQTYNISGVIHQDVLFDSVSVKEASYRTPWVSSAVGGYDERDYRLHNPLSDYSEELDEYMYESGFCTGAWIFSDWADDGVDHYILQVPGTAGSNNRMILYKSGVNQATFRIYDGAAGFLAKFLAVTNTNWTAGDWKYVEACTDNTGTTIAHHYNVNNSTWYAWSDASGAGTGIQDGQSDELHVGHGAAATFLDGYISEINMVPYSAIFPQAGFNSGKPPVNGKPY